MVSRNGTMLDVSSCAVLARWSHASTFNVAWCAVRKSAVVLIVSAAGLVIAACSGGAKPESLEYSPRVVQPGAPIPKGGGRYKLGRPYTVKGRLYTPRHQPNYSRTGVASWYGRDFHGRLTANGEVYDMNQMSAAHPTLPLPSLVEVTNMRTGRKVVVRVNDRGPFARGRIIDLSYRAATELELVGRGVGEVHVRYVGPARL